ncbi:MAG: hypothetical protein IKP88_18790 [Lachnospiraceae bacterium]|nr:hypothetical protein [Lachnospiraceae bacterium]
MKTERKLLGLLLVAIMFVSVFAVLTPNVGVSAAEGLGTPKITLKRINSGTGVKITISKTKGAAGYFIYITNTDNTYSKYMHSDGKDERLVGQLEKDGTKKRTYKIKGLPKGKYTFKVMAYDSNWEYNNYSAEKTIKIKAAKVKDTKEKSYDFSKVKVGEVVEFGSYEQDANMNNGKEAIEWIVLSKDKNQMLLISKYALDTLPYNKEYKGITWENCTLREWLNKSFYKTAFTDKERKMIKNTKLTNADNTVYGTPGGSDTKDNVFLLSFDDIKNTEYGFSSEYRENDIARRCAPTAYAVAQGAYTDYMYMTKDGENTCCWWLRSPGDGAIFAAAVVGYGGGAGGVGSYVISEGDSVRPAIYVSLK